MKLRPTKLKFNKYNKGKAINRIKSKNLYSALYNGTIAIKALKNCNLSAKQIENIYFTLNKFLKKSATIYIKIFPQKPVSKKPNEFRMGKGKGAIDHWVCQILPGTLICEIETNNISKAVKAISYIKFRLPIKIKTVIT